VRRARPRDRARRAHNEDRALRALSSDRALRALSADRARRALPRELARRVDALAQAGDRLGLGVALVGGPVRDLLLGRDGVDVDLIVEPRAGADGHAARRLAEAVLAPGEAIVAHARFGTVTLAGAAGAIDLAAARAERYAAPGALPEVSPGTLEQDLARRDFGVNAMALPLNAVARAGRGALVDPLGGRGDLAAKRLRILHERSFHDDPTRAFRAARLAARLGLRLDGGSRRALVAALAAGAFDAVSGERFRAELAKLFAEPDPGRALAWLERWGVLGRLSRGLGLAPEARRALHRLGPLLGAERAGEAPDALEAGLCVWLEPLTPAVRRRALERLALRGRPAARVQAFPTLASRTRRALRHRPGRGAADAVLRGLAREELYALAAGSDAASRRRILRHAREDRALRLPIDGSDLAALGLGGPALGRTLAAIRRAFLDGALRDRAAALAFARRRVRQRP
jgi:tRNA nucleotidyltransferase (CCA-adding enzyme)